MATVGDLVVQGKLVRFQPLLDPGEQPQRFVYMALGAHEWCFSTEELGHSAPCAMSFDRVHATLDDFCAGAMLYEGAHIRSLRPRREKVWELKTVPPERHSVRIFGWFYRPAVLIVSLCKYKNDVSIRCALERELVLTHRGKLPLDEPKTAREKTYEPLMQIDRR